MTKNSRTRHHLASIALLTAVAMFSPLQVWATPPTQPSSSKSVPRATPSISGTTRKIEIPPAALQRQIQQLERAKHILELSAGNDPSSHSAVAARHIQVAINELKTQLKEKAQQAAATGSSGAHGGATAPPMRMPKPSVSKK